MIVVLYQNIVNLNGYRGHNVNLNIRFKIFEDYL